jgi:hypothetical protein
MKVWSSKVAPILSALFAASFANGFIATDRRVLFGGDRSTRTNNHQSETIITPLSVVERTALYMSSPKSQQDRFRRPKKTVQDRSQEEAISLVRDIIQAAVDAGPRAAPARTLQAYMALSTTLRDFSPLQPPGKSAESFSTPVALRKLFERMGATYIKLGQFVASSPTLFPKEYVKEFQKCLDSTEPLDWSLIKGVIEKELGKLVKK